MKKILVTGGTGFLGSSLVITLVKAGYNVRVFDNNFRGALRRLSSVKGKFEFVRGDIRNAPLVKKAVRGCDSVVHLAYINGTEFFYSMPEVVLDVGVKGTINVLDACIKEGVGEFLFVSSSEVYQTPGVIPTPEKVALTIPDPFNPRYSYGGGKILGELLTIHYGKKYFKRAMIVRPHNVYGPDMGGEHVIPQFIVRMQKNSPLFPIQGTGAETRSFCYIDDCTNAFMRVIEAGAHLEIYNIGNDQETTIREVAIEVGNYFGKKVHIVPGELKIGGTLRRCPDISKIRTLGYTPTVTLSQGIAMTAQWYAK